jgi:tetratricopeptide (TPR) repeat protein
MSIIRNCLRPHIIYAALLFASSGQAADFQQGVLQYEGRHYSAARQIFSDVELEQGATIETDFYLGRLALWFDDLPEALPHLERCASLAPQQAQIQNALGDACGLAAQRASIFAKLGWAKRCLAAYERAVDLEPKNPAWHWSLIGYYINAPCLAGGGMGKAYTQAEEIQRLDAANGRVAFATVYLADGRYSEAFAEFAQVLRNSPDDFLALYQIGRCAAISGQQLDRGIVALRRCLVLPEPEPATGMPSYTNVHYRLGNLLEKKGRTEEAKREYARAVATNADFRPAKVALRN